MSDSQATLNFLASLPIGHSTVDKPTLREMLLSTGGQLLVQGRLRDIKTKHLGAGVYKVWTELTNGE